MYVTPRRQMQTDDGLVLTPSVSRLIDNHPFVRANPGAFERAEEQPGDHFRERGDAYRTRSPGSARADDDDGGPLHDRAQATTDHFARARAAGAVEDEEHPDARHPRAGTRAYTDPRYAERDRGLRVVDRFRSSGELSAAAADNLDTVLRKADPSGADSRYLQAIGDPAYNRAFGKVLMDQVTGHLSFEPDEVEAWRAVARSQQERALFERAMSLTTTAGGFAVPFTLDPTVMLTSNGALNPIRQLARTITISTDQWKGVSSAGVTASYDAEASEVSDDSPVLAQPVIDCARGVAFVPFSIELGQDWASIQQELVGLISDGRDVLDATQFLTGSGTDSPAGVLTGATQTVTLAGTASFVLADVYTVKQALPARWMDNATWAFHPNRLDAVYRFVAAGSTTEPQIMPGGRDGPLLGKPVAEWSAMTTTLTSGQKPVIYGDFFAAFTIADRIGMQVELIPHLFGGSARPTGQRGLYAIWRTGSKVVVPEALRVGVTA
jgi:HK97 family phage major capsid protein